MEQLYKNYWADETCLSSALQVMGLSALIFAAVLGLLGVLSWLMVRRQTEAERRATVRVLQLVAAGTIPLLLAAAAYATFFTTSLRSIHIADGGFIVRMCQGPREVALDLASIDVTGIDYRWRRAGGKSNEPVDEMVISRIGGEPIVMPLSTDPQALNFPLLKKAVPHRVIAQWIAERRKRGWNIPPELAAIE
ncbi:hypothetical protein [Hyphomicrobium sulfonivorans]|uniref:hypothetical protein n=1 Tax=Hyphomicrobium sulfonivorans TaxID=121290 RepID=UPI00156FFE6B|nr:hypothetical protein [Hyphomicrobium sulfonivorans]MBI1648903.1 hypothetical protein [Hyphomicrobium sulfonivorans]NSL70561.1 hypothetical protein [Hyphomicrobium sulfonivorans]